MFRETITADWEGHEVSLASDTHMIRGISYTLSVDGQTVATTSNRLKRPGHFEVAYELEREGASHTVRGLIHQRLTGATLRLEIDGEHLPERPPTSAELASKKRSRLIRIGILVVAVVILAVCLPSAFPTRLAHVAEQWEPSSRTAGRKRGECDTLVTRAGCDPVSVSNSSSADVAIPSTHPDRGLETLHGTLTLPEGPPAPHPAILLISGSGGTPRDPEMRGGLVVHHDPFRVYGALTELFVELGFAVLRYDKRTCRPCYPDFEPDLPAFGFTDFEDDARDAYRWLRAREDVDDDNLVLVGHSQGGGIVARLAGELPGVRAVVMLAGSVFPFRQGLSGQLRRFADIRLAQLDLINYWLLHDKADDFEACLEEASAAPKAPQECLFNVTFRAFDEEAARAATTLPTLSSLDIPLFALQGALDRNIDPRSLETVAEAVADRDAEVHVIGGVGHTLVHEADRDDPHLSPEVAELLRTFLASVPRAGSAPP